MSAIYRRELRSYIVTQTGAIFIALFLLVMNLYFYYANIETRSGDLAGVFSFILTVLMFTVPLLTMRLMAGERRGNTEVLLLGAPLNAGVVICAKFLAAMTVFAAALIFSAFPWIITISAYGHIAAAATAGHITALVIFAAVYIAIGLFVSCLTENQVIAAVATLGAFLALYLLDVAAALASNDLISGFLDAVSIFRRYEGFSRGIFSASDIFFCICLCVIFLYLSARVFENRRLRKGKQTALFSGALALACLTALCVTVAALDNRFYWRLDLTEARLFTLSTQTAELLAALDEPVTVTVLSPKNYYDGNYFDEITGAVYNLSDAREVLDRYISLSGGMIESRYIDPELNPSFVREHNDSGTLQTYDWVIESASRYAVLKMEELFETELYTDESGYNVYEATVGMQAESKLSGAIAYVSAERVPAAQIVTGHDEFGLSELYSLMTQNGFEPVEYRPALDEPDMNAALTVIASPQYDYTDAEIQALEAFLSEAGHYLFVFFDPETPELPALEAWLEEWGARFESVLALDSEMFVLREDYLLPVLDQNERTDAIRPQSGSGPYMVLTGARKLSRLFDSYDKRVTSLLLSSYDTAYGKSLEDIIDSFERDSGDEDGPFTLALFSSQYIGQNAESGVLFAPLSAVMDDALASGSFLNRRWISALLSGINGAAQPLDIPPRGFTDSTIVMTAAEARACFWLLVIALPLLIWGAGCLYWFKRRAL